MIEFRAERPIWTDSLILYARTERDHKVSAIVCNVKIVPAAKGELWPRCLELPMLDGDGQQLFDALWRVGYRPHNGEASAAHVEAMNHHLADMRRLVFKGKL